jgi:hypothetical protein
MSALPAATQHEAPIAAPHCVPDPSGARRPMSGRSSDSLAQKAVVRKAAFLPPQVSRGASESCAHAWMVLDRPTNLDQPLRRARPARWLWRVFFACWGELAVYLPNSVRSSPFARSKVCFLVALSCLPPRLR